jgi:molybdopterin-containing oxidoreductase family iron-sulfur binding subunit
MKACPSRAIKKRSDGIIVIDEDSCCGFRACVTACPYGAIQVPTDNDMYGTGVFTLLDKYSISRHPANVAQKCTLCAHRIDAGVLRPACVEVCPTECRIFGDLNDPDSRVSKLRAENTLIQLRSDAKSRPSVGYMLATADGKMSGQGIQ